MYKIFRHIFSGYFLERGKIIRKLKQPNRFIPTEIKYTLPKIVVYTVSTGGYDTIKDPVYIDKDFDYYVFTNVKLKANRI